MENEINWKYVFTPLVLANNTIVRKQMTTNEYNIAHEVMDNWIKWIKENTIPNPDCFKLAKEIELNSQPKPEPEDNEIYCHQCGEDDIKNLAYQDQYANGDYYKCKTCGEYFFHTPNQDS